MKQPSHLVAYRDAEGEQTLYFGPFVNQSIAQFFKAALPEPLRGGACRIVPLQPFTQQEGHLVNQKIMQDRRVHA